LPLYGSQEQHRQLTGTTIFYLLARHFVGRECRNEKQFALQPYCGAISL
jgi:hypothetical protein